MAVTTSKDCTAIKNGHPLTAASRWAKEPRPRTAEMAGRPVDLDRIPSVLPIAAILAVAVLQDYVPRRRRHPDIADRSPRLRP